MLARNVVLRDYERRSCYREQYCSSKNIVALVPVGNTLRSGEENVLQIVLAGDVPFPIQRNAVNQGARPAAMVRRPVLSRKRGRLLVSLRALRSSCIKPRLHYAKRIAATGELHLRYGVALAGRFLEAFAVENIDASSRVRNEPRASQHRKRDRHARPPAAKHHRQVFVREQYTVASYAIVRHKEPTTRALVDRVQTVAGNKLAADARPFAEAAFILRWYD